MIKLFLKKLTLLSVMSILLISCYPSETIPISDLDTTSTFYIEEDFSPAPTKVSIIWDVAQIKENDGDDLPYNGEVDDEILNTTLSNLVSLYGEDNVWIINPHSTLSPTPINPNVKVVFPSNVPSEVQVTIGPSIILRKNFVAGIYPGYPWWPGWWGPCWYCGYPPYVSYERYDSGNIILDWVDLRKHSFGSSDDVSPSWVAINRGILSSDESFNAERVVLGINQAFEQSPYLK